MDACYFCGLQGLGVKLKKVPVEKRLVITAVIQEEDPKTHSIRAYSKSREEIKREESACLTCMAKSHLAEITEVRDESKAKT